MFSDIAVAIFKRTVVLRFEPPHGLRKCPLKHEVAIVEDVNSSKYCQRDWESVCADWTVSQRLFWETAVATFERPLRGSLLVANAVAATGDALDVFRRLQGKPVPTLAIVSGPPPGSDSRHDQLEIAREFVWP